MEQPGRVHLDAVHAAGHLLHDLDPVALPFEGGTEIGQVRCWLPGEKLAFGWRLPSFKAEQATEVEVRFEAVGAETRVTVEHRGWDTIPQRHVARHGFELMLFQRRLGEHWRGLLKAMEAGL